MTYHTLFDTGPESKSLPRNIRALAVDTTVISRVILSHWHADHTGGLLSFLSLRSSQETAGGAVGVEKCIVDVHPSRPIARGIAPPPGNKVLVRLPADPTFDEIVRAGGVVEKHAEGHAVAGGTVWVSFSQRYEHQ